MSLSCASARYFLQAGDNKRVQRWRRSHLLQLTCRDLRRLVSGCRHRDGDLLEAAALGAKHTVRERDRLTFKTVATRVAVR